MGALQRRTTIEAIRLQREQHNVKNIKLKKKTTNNNKNKTSPPAQKKNPSSFNPCPDMQLKVTFPYNEQSNKTQTTTIMCDVLGNWPKNKAQD